MPASEKQPGERNSGGFLRPESLKTDMTARGHALHPGKTRLIEFGRHAAKNRRARGLGKPETFDFLGFTHISGKSRRGGFLLRRKSRSDRLRAKLQVVKEELRRRMHETIDEQGA
jgi:RNA-directed DNA polymerase